MVDISSPFVLQQAQHSFSTAPYTSQAQNIATPHNMSARPSRRGFVPTVAQPRTQTGLTNTSSSASNQPTAQSDRNTSGQQLAHTAFSPVNAAAYSTAPPVLFNQALGTNKWLTVPQDTNIRSTTTAQRVDNYDSTLVAEDPWQLAVGNQRYSTQHHALFAQYPGLPPDRRVTPAIQITPGSSTYIRQQDQSFEASPFRPLQQQQQQQDYLSPLYTAMAYEQANEISQRHVPVSPVSHHSGPSRGVTPIGEPITRKRSFSQLDQATDSALDDPSHNGIYDETPPQQRITRTIKRSDAPINENNKYICTVSSECVDMTFDRKCEWSKHMDKHDRPYRCPHEQCAKLQGFTYSGGLLRHEREVHNKHGGPKAFLMCPHPNCKRHTDKGFTRRENLQEHLRRVHAGKDDPAQITDVTDLETPASALSGPENEELYAALNVKGPRSINDDHQRTVFPDVDDLRTQVERLKAENSAKDAVIQRLEEDARMQNDRIFALEQRLMPLQPPAA
ncbi:hypothetical protein AMS68_001771 [Peltaster fructicola]|uniref:C2H2 type master regulator of conidiophore development brlA n=1 Tax=Peltaster fructicola TaxID=286661 RepID=A0A6H0XNF8_9PEZI|nr:hypothetical protein AMS68_001771 [Peltaster fructicola]